MKKILSVLAIFCFSLLFSGCGKIEEGWNGIYTNDTNYSVLIYTADNKTASIAVLQTGENYKFYPIEYPNHLSVTENELTVIRGEPVKIVRDGLKIKIISETEEKTAWTKIVGEYTKTKNVKGFGLNQF